MGCEGPRAAQGGRPLSRGAGILALFAVFGSGCGYRVGGLVQHRRIKLSVLDNATERRTHEFDLTGTLARELVGAGIAVNSPEAEVELRGRISDFREPTVVTTGADEVLISSVSIELELFLVRIRDGVVLWKDARRESASFATPRAESRETARQEVFQRLARWALTKLEEDW